MRVHKPKVEYKLALQEKPQGSILTYYYKTNNLTRINWLNTRLIIASNKIRHEMPFKTKRVKYTAIWKKPIKIVKESKPSFFLHCAQCFTYPSLFNFISLLNFFLFPFSTILLFSVLNVFIPSSTIFYYFPSSMFFIPLHHNFNIFPQFHYFPPQCYYSLLYNFTILVNLYRISMQEDPH